MLSNHNLGALMGAPVTGPNDEKIGTVSQVFVDPDTGRPNWVTVHTGLFGRHESFVPVEDATWDHEILHIPFEKDVVKDAPRVDTGQALSPEDEVSLYRYYRVPIGDDDGGVIMDRDSSRDRHDDQHDLRDRHDDRNDAHGAPIAAAAATTEPESASAPHQSAAEPTVADRLAEATRRFVEKEKGAHGHDSADRQDSAETDDSASRAETNEQASGGKRMRRYVIVEEEMPMEGDGQQGPGDSGAPRSS